MKVIETRYGGVEFRSRIEARYAVFFDALNEPWEYEPEGFVLAGGERYLPDFWLPEMSCYFEIKGAQPTDQEYSKAEGLFIATKRPVAIVNGMPGENWGTLYCPSDLPEARDWNVQLGSNDAGRLAFLVDTLDVTRPTLWAVPYSQPLRIAFRWIGSPAVKLAAEQAKSERFEKRGREI